MARTEFDEAYYRRFYRDPRRRIGTEESTARLVRFVAAYLAHLEVPVKSVLDLGCGLGWWKDPVLESFPAATWTGVERSEHLCEELGWQRGSVADWDGPPADLVVCQGVLQYLSDRDVKRALRNLDRLAKRAIYVEIVTREDWSRTIDRDKSDREIEIRPASLYRQALDRRFEPCGGGLWLRRSEAHLFELERGQSFERAVSAPDRAGTTRSRSGR